MISSAPLDAVTDWTHPVDEDWLDHFVTSLLSEYSAKPYGFYHVTPFLITEQTSGDNRANVSIVQVVVDSLQNMVEEAPSVTQMVKPGTFRSEGARKEM